MQRLALLFRHSTIALAIAISGSLLFPQHASAQLRDQIKNRVVDDVANQLVSEIQSDSCPQFESMLKSRKSGGNSGKAGGMMKSDPAMRQRFVNKVAGPLVNKMIDCNLLPGK